jgi:hypothetical protein
MHVRAMVSMPVVRAEGAASRQTAVRLHFPQPTLDTIPTYR